MFVSFSFRTSAYWLRAWNLNAAGKIGRCRTAVSDHRRASSFEKGAP
jgi:hypothetical protein